MISCQNCGQSVDESSNFCGYCGAKIHNTAVQIQQPGVQSSFVTISPDGQITVEARSLQEAKLALKELKLKKKELSLLKRQVTEQERAIRAGYTDAVRRRGSKIQGGGGIGRFIRMMQTASRDSARRNLAEQLAHYEQERRRIESMKSAIDQLILQVESIILRNS